MASLPPEDNSTRSSSCRRRQPATILVATGWKLAALASLTLCSCTALTTDRSLSSIPMTVPTRSPEASVTSQPSVAPPPAAIATTQPSPTRVETTGTASVGTARTDMWSSPAAGNGVVPVQFLLGHPPAISHGSPTPSFNPDCPPQLGGPPQTVWNGTVPCPPDCEFCPSQPRIALQERAQLNHDEFLCDGGDRGYPVHYHSGSRQGLETEDTVAEFRDHTGEFHMRPSNKVCVYAPRFGAVRSLRNVNEDVAVDRLAAAIENRRTSGLHSPLAVADHGRSTPPVGIRVRSRASGVENNDVMSAFSQNLSPAVQQQTQEALQKLAFVQRGELHRGEEAFLAERIDAALVWTRDAHPQIQARSESPQEAYTSARPHQYVLSEKEERKGDLRIVKLADRKVAQQGDVITFTIRYDNLGDRELTEVQIVDNLTTRLEFIEGSETSDRLADFTAASNGEGSHVLTFQLTEPLPGRTGGVLTFQTRVR